MSVIELARLGKRMRELQAKYGRSHDHGDLLAAIELQRQFDQAVREVIQSGAPTVLDTKREPAE